MSSRKRLCMALAVVFLVNILIICFIQNAGAASYKKGSTGSVVSQIQTKLTAWGYYSAGIDGVYGSKTEAAVKHFQQKNGLTVDGIAGAKTLAAMGINDTSGSAANSNSSDVALLADRKSVV